MSDDGMLWSDQAGGVPSIRARIAVVMLVVAWFLLMVDVGYCFAMRIVDMGMRIAFTVVVMEVWW